MPVLPLKFIAGDSQPGLHVRLSWEGLGEGHSEKELLLEPQAWSLCASYILEAPWVWLLVESPSLRSERLQGSMRGRPQLSPDPPRAAFAV